MKKITIFASGSGSNAENIINYFKNDTENVVKIVFCNKPDAYVLERAKRLSVPTFVFGREEFSHSDLVLNELKRLDIDLIVLAGFLWKVPDAIIDAYPDRVINIHPALLPSYGGKGMYGMKVHEAVFGNESPCLGIRVFSSCDQGIIRKGFIKFIKSIKFIR